MCGKCPPKDNNQNPRITNKDFNLIRGALRRAFSRSALRNEVLNNNIIKHSDIERPKVKTWVFCNECGILDAKSYMTVDHIAPLVALDSSMKEMSFDDFVNNMWCDIANLQVLCKSCHKAKSAAEMKQRAVFRKLKKD